MLLSEPSGNLFGMTQDAGMGWNPADVNKAQVLIVSHRAHGSETSPPESERPER
jgi:hypothetical protein